MQRHAHKEFAPLRITGRHRRSPFAATHEVGKTIKAEFALLFFGTVADDALLLENGCDAFREEGVFGAGRGHRDGQKRDALSPYS